MELASKYFYAKGEEQTGPHSLAEIESKIRDGEIKPDTKIWTKGMADWQTAESVDDIVNIFNEIPPSLQNAAQSDNETKPSLKDLGINLPEPIFLVNASVFILFLLIAYRVVTYVGILETGLNELMLLVWPLAGITLVSSEYSKNRVSLKRPVLHTIFLHWVAFVFCCIAYAMLTLFKDYGWVSY